MQAARDAALAPATWVPLAAALALQLGDSDEKLSDWARRETPVFGSTEDAKHMSDVLYWSTVAGYGVTFVAAHLPGDEERVCSVGILRRAAAGAVAQAVTSGATDLIKDETDRLRPDGSNRRSFVSGHSSSAAVAATLAGRNVEWTPLSGRPVFWTRAGLSALAAGTAWARVEGGRHYPSDVLAGLALGHFVGAFVSDVLLGRVTSHTPEVGVRFTPEEAAMSVSWNF